MDPSQSRTGTPTSRWPRPRHYESVNQREKPTPNVLGPVYRSEHFGNPLLLNVPRHHRLENGDVKVKREGRRNRVLQYLRDHQFGLFATLPLLAALLKIALLAYFFMAYISLPPDPRTGALPRISPAYSTWPFISCIGSLRLAVYKAFGFVVLVLYQGGSLVNFYLSRDKKDGYWFRRAGAATGLTSTILLISPTFSSGNTDSHTHLFITGAKILATLATKTTVLTCDHLDRHAKPVLRTIPAAVLMRRWKEVIAGLSILLATTADIGIYTCTDPVQIQTPGTTCFKIMAVGAPAEWAMSIMWINWMLNMAYDVYTHERIAATGKAAATAMATTTTYSTDEGSSSPTVSDEPSDEKRWSPRAEDFELDDAPFLRAAEYLAKAWTAPADNETHYGPVALGELAAVRGFV